MSKARKLADLLGSTGDVKTEHLDNADASLLGISDGATSTVLTTSNSGIDVTGTVTASNFVGNLTGTASNADLLDGQQGSYYSPAHSHPYLPLSGGTLTGALKTSGGITGLTLTNGIAGNNFNISGVNQITINDPGEGILFTGSTNVHLAAIDDSTDSIMNFNGASELRVNNNKVWHTGNDGSGSGLDADLLDGKQASEFATSGHSHSEITTTQIGDNAHVLTNMNTPALWSKPAGYMTMVRASGSNGLPANHGQNYFGYTVTSRRDTGTGYSAILSAYNNNKHWITYNNNHSNYPIWREIWTSASDGSGSGLDADLLDGVQASGFATSGHAHNKISFDSNSYVEAQDTKTRIQTNSGYLDVGPMNTSWCHFQTDRSNFYMGTNLHVDGWVKKYSGGASYWHPDNDGSGSGLDADLLDGIDWTSTTARRKLGLSALTNYDRNSSNTGIQYHTGAMGWGATDFNTLFSYGSGHIDTWSNPANQPSGTSHWVGHQSLHHHASASSRHGHQFVVGAGNPSLTYLRGAWGSSFTSWAKMWNSANDGSGSGLDADTVDGKHASELGKTAGATSIITFTSSGTWTKPSWCTRIRVQVVGGGGGGCGYNESGGGGGYSEEIIDNPSATVSVSVGGAGTSKQYYGAAGDGGTSSFGSYCTSTGGYGANRNNSHSGGAGGTGSGGQVAFRGGGGTGHTNSNGSGSPAKGGGTYFGGGAGDNRGASNSKVQNGAPGTGGPGSRGNTGWRGATGESGAVVIYQYK